MPDAPEVARESPEIDAFPANAKMWELTEAKRTRDGVQPIASEHIDGLFGSESQFHRTHGFYIDGVDETTAKLPKGWRRRAVTVQTESAGRTVTGVAPAPEDLIVVESREAGREGQAVRRGDPCQEATGPRSHRAKNLRDRSGSARCREGDIVR